MQIGLIGLPQAGKRTLFRLLTGVDPSATAPSAKGTTLGISTVRDPRIDRLAAMYRPKKLTPATIQYVLLPDLTKEAEKNRTLFQAVETVDALCHIVRAFEDESVFHVDGSINPMRDVQQLQAELLLNDLVFIEKRLERIAKETARSGLNAERKAEQAVLERCRQHLETEQPLRTLTLTEQELKPLTGYPLMTPKACLVALNVGEGQVADAALQRQVLERYGAHGVGVVQVSAKIEQELEQLDPSERAGFLKELGIDEPALAKMTRACYERLGLMSYFTVGEDEVRAWTVRRGANAQEAAGAIHSDLSRTFIRAEHMTFDDLVTLGSEEAAKQAGKWSLKSREFIVQDGDILSFRAGG